MNNTLLSVENGLRLKIAHGATSSALNTDAPAFHGGNGSSFSPTDLCEAALVSCTATLILVKAGSLGLDFSGMTAEAAHEMQRGEKVRIGSVSAIFNVPVDVEERHRRSICRSAAECPVRNSLHPDIAIDLRIRWNDGSEDRI